MLQGTRCLKKGTPHRSDLGMYTDGAKRYLKTPFESTLTHSPSETKSHVKGFEKTIFKKTSQVHL